MDILNVEFKARVSNLEEYEERLNTIEVVFQGEDHQVDTYFKVEEGRVKLREGNIENSLIYYSRVNQAGAKSSDVVLHKCESTEGLKKILLKMAPILIVVDKHRRIYFVDNVKFHFDRVEGLGTFIEVEAIDQDGTIGIEKLKEQCDYFYNFFKLDATQLVATSYSDLLGEKE